MTSSSVSRAPSISALTRMLMRSSPASPALGDHARGVLVVGALPPSPGGGPRHRGPRVRADPRSTAGRSRRSSGRLPEHVRDDDHRQLRGDVVDEFGRPRSQTVSMMSSQS